MEHVTPPTPTSPGPHRSDWPYVVGAVLALAIRSGWAPYDVCSLAFVMLGLVAAIHIWHK